MTSDAGTPRVGVAPIGAGTIGRTEAEDFAVAGLHFASGAVGSLVASTATSPRGRETITVHGQHGSMRLGAEAVEVTWRDGRRERDPPVADRADEEGAVVVRHERRRAVFEDSVEAVREGRAPMIGGRVALASHRLIEAIETSSRPGAAVELAHRDERPRPSGPTSASTSTRETLLPFTWRRGFPSGILSARRAGG